MKYYCFLHQKTKAKTEQVQNVVQFLMATPNTNGIMQTALSCHILNKFSIQLISTCHKVGFHFCNSVIRTHNIYIYIYIYIYINFICPFHAFALSDRLGGLSYYYCCCCCS
jgi:hypothetical protein